MIVRDLHEDCIAAEDTGSRKTILISRIYLCPLDPPIPFKFYRRRFPTKIAFPETSLKDRPLNMFE
jgi:hypothetical protein